MIRSIAWRTLCRLAVAGGLCAASDGRAAGDEQWDHRFAVAGVPGGQGPVWAMAFENTNSFFLGGMFHQVGQTRAEAIAHIREGQVHALPGGPPSRAPTPTIYDLHWFDNRLYAGG
ncbi:MAG: hypothetical protein N2438_13970, partial [Limisphaera sp.]|nr:hypothetical protein [Limisphaera sp.]